MSTVTDIIAKFGGQTALSEKSGWSQSTISAWVTRDPAEIPPWRRPYLAKFAEEAGIELTKSQREYLASTTRTPSAATQQAA